MTLTLKNILLNLSYYSVTILVIPWGLLSLETVWGFPRDPSPSLHYAAIILGTVGFALQLWCIALFQRIGQGTPSPLSPPRELVTEGPYAWVRNPLNTGEVLVLLALAAWFGSPLLFFYALGAWLAFHSFIVLSEEPKHLQRFGDQYVEYKATVNRWIPKLRGISELRRG
jgi:protein-S-isoprenylcysteine O-methyltransferase Ste14